MAKKIDISGATVLLVDDDQFLRSMYAAKFKAKGANVIEAGTSEEALEKLRGGLAPKLITFDLVMPGVDGYGFIEELQKAKLAPDAAKVALSNQSSPEEIARVMELGADGHLTKANATPSEVVEKIIEMIS